MNEQIEMYIDIMTNALMECECIGIERDHSMPVCSDGYVPYHVTYHVASNEVTIRTYSLPQYAYPEFFPPNILLQTIANGFEWVGEGHPAQGGNYVYMLDSIFPFDVSEHLLWEVVYRAGYTKVEWNKIKTAIANRVD